MGIYGHVYIYIYYILVSLLVSKHFRLVSLLVSKHYRLVSLLVSKLLNSKIFGIEIVGSGFETVSKHHNCDP